MRQPARVDARSLAERLAPGRGAFNRGEHFLAHELWEEAWHELEGAERLFAQGLIQIAAGLHHLQQGRPRPAAGLLRKGLGKLSASAGAEPADFRVEPLALAVGTLLTTLTGPGATAPDPGALKL